MGCSAHPTSRWIWGTRDGNGTSCTVWRPPVRGGAKTRTVVVCPVCLPVPSATNLKKD
jgi:hypothetical protein